MCPIYRNVIFWILLFTASQVNAQLPSDPLSYSQTTRYSYDATTGQLLAEITEPYAVSICVSKNYSYDKFGNAKGGVIQNCSGATGKSVFKTRTVSSNFVSQQVAVAGQNIATPLGMFPAQVTNSLGQSSSEIWDPRFGVATLTIGPNGSAETTSRLLDDFGRVIKEIHFDSTVTTFSYCLLGTIVADISSNSVDCDTPSANEVPPTTAYFNRQDMFDAAGVKNGPTARFYFDRMGRKIRSVTESYDGIGGVARKIVRDVEYNSLGLIIYESQPYFLDTNGSTSTGSTHGFTILTYDDLGRISGIYVADSVGLHMTPAIAGHPSQRAAATLISSGDYIRSEENDNGKVKFVERNIDGLVVRVMDANDAITIFQYDAFGNLIKTKDALNNVVSTSYNVRGSRMSLSDPDSGVTRYDHDALGETVWQQSANQVTQGDAIGTAYVYDALGRITQRIESPYVSPGSVNSSFTSTWSYDQYSDGSTCLMGIGKLCEAKTDNGVSRKVFYDVLGRPSRTQLLVSSGPTFTNSIGYDSITGRVNSRIYPSGLKVNYAYSQRGYLENINNGTTPYWLISSVNAWGRIEQQQAGNGVVGKTTYDELTGRKIEMSDGANGSVLHHTYQFDSLSNLVYRADLNGTSGNRAVTENFLYDNLNRLWQYKVSGPDITKSSNFNRVVEIEYNAGGMILSKSDVGIYKYPDAGSLHPHLIREVDGTQSNFYKSDANGNIVSGGKISSISYNSFDLPDSYSGILAADGTRYTWSYDSEHSRIKEVRTKGAEIRTTWEVHPDSVGGLGFEQEVINGGGVTNRNYLTVSGNVIGMITTEGLETAPENPQPTDASAQIKKIEYWHKDNLGSISAITDGDGVVIQRLSYDPFGKRRFSSGDYDASGSLIIDNAQGTDRGFTGHENLDDIGIVHMNGRLYDPVLGRVMQADPLIGDPENFQNYDRYSYVLNNPLSATDPSGFDEIPTVNISAPSPTDTYGGGNYGGGTLDQYINVDSHSWVTRISANPLFKTATDKVPAIVVKGPRPPKRAVIVVDFSFFDGYTYGDSPFRKYANTDSGVYKACGRACMSNAGLKHLSEDFMDLMHSDPVTKITEPMIAECGPCEILGMLGKSMNAVRVADEFTPSVALGEGVIPKIIVEGQKATVSAGVVNVVDLTLYFKEGWSAAQRTEAMAKVKILTESKTVVSKSVRSTTSASKRYKSAGNTVAAGKDVDHAVDLQLGGGDTVSNMWPLDSSVNRSLGVQIHNLIKDLPLGTEIGTVTIQNRR